MIVESKATFAAVLHPVLKPMRMKPQNVLFIFLAAISLLFAGCGASKGKETAEKAVGEFHEQLDKENFKEIYSAAHPDFKAASTEGDFIARLDAVHSKLGKLEKSDQTGSRVNSVKFKTNVVLTYNTKFSKGDATETFTYRINGDHAQLYDYDIKSGALITE
jgi:hypothetical protein